MSANRRVDHHTVSFSKGQLAKLEALQKNLSSDFGSVTKGQTIAMAISYLAEARGVSVPVQHDRPTATTLLAGSPA